MTNSTKSPNTAAAQEIDPATLDQIAGAGIVMPEADLRKQEQSDKLNVRKAGERPLDI